MTIERELAKLGAVLALPDTKPEAPVPLPEVEETYIGHIQRGNEGIKSERAEWYGPNERAPLPVYPQPGDTE